jgi:hypothetical protein
MDRHDDRESDVHLAILRRLAENPVEPRRAQRLLALGATLLQQLRRTASIRSAMVVAAVRRCVAAQRAAARSWRGDGMAMRVTAERGRKMVERTVGRFPASSRRIRAAALWTIGAAAILIGERLAAARGASRRALGPAAYGAGMVALAVLALLGWRNSLSIPQPSPLGDEVVVALPEPAAESPASIQAKAVVDTERDARLREVEAALGARTLSDEEKLALVEEVAGYAGEAATDVLLAAAESPSLLVAMASIRGLRGRPCERVAAPLALRMGHADWQRRAWAAKILGESGCTAAAPALRERLARERDARVRQQLTGAIAALDAAADGC